MLRVQAAGQLSLRASRGSEESIALLQEHHK